MKLMHRNLQPFWYCLRKNESVPITDSDGYETGEWNVLYENPVAMQASISPAEGRIYSEEYGLREDYDKVLIIEDVDCPIKEDSVLYIDTEPILDEHGAATNAYDYIVQRIAPALNHFKVIARKVKVS